MGNCRPVIKVDKVTGKILGEYESIIAAAEDNHLLESSLSCVLDKEHTLGGYKWKRLKVYNGVKTGFWSKEEDDYLTENMGKKRPVDIAKHLNRTYKAVSARIARKRKSNKEFEHVEEKNYQRTEEDYIVSSYGLLSVEQIARELGKSVEYVLKTADYIAKLYPYQEERRILGITKMYRAKMAAEKLYVGQKTKFGKIKEIYPHVVIVSKNGKRECYTKMEVVGFTEVRRGGEEI